MFENEQKWSKTIVLSVWLDWHRSTSVPEYPDNQICDVPEQTNVTHPPRSASSNCAQLAGAEESQEHECVRREGLRRERAAHVCSELADGCGLVNYDQHQAAAANGDWQAEGYLGGGEPTHSARAQVGACCGQVVQAPPASLEHGPCWRSPGSASPDHPPVSRRSHGGLGDDCA
eukprot:6179243-Pleurochrysis_carterae.AAC.1